MMERNIFLADDDLDDVELFQEALEDVCTSCTLISSKNGVELLKKLSASHLPPQVIFIDINMPVMNGLECLKYIRSRENLKNVPVVILTTSTSPGTIAHAYKLGASLFAEKPSEFGQLKKLINYVIEMDLSQMFPSGISKFVYKAA
jgi:CheY-like chemotaxis protein